MLSSSIFSQTNSFRALVSPHFTEFFVLTISYIPLVMSVFLMYVLLKFNKNYVEVINFRWLTHFSPLNGNFWILITSIIFKSFYQIVIVRNICGHYQSFILNCEFLSNINCKVTQSLPSDSHDFHFHQEAKNSVLESMGFEVKTYLLFYYLAV